MIKRQNIFCIEQNLDGTTGGSYRSLLYLIKLLDKKRFMPVVAFYRDHDLLPEFRNSGCKVMTLRYPHPIDINKHFYFLKGRFLTIFRMILMPIQKSINFIHVSLFLFIRNLYLLIKEDINLVHLNNGVTVGMEFLVAAKVLGVPCTAHQRGIHPVARWQRILARRLDHVVCVSDAARDNLIREGLSPDRCTTVHNGMDPAHFLARITRTPEVVRKELGIAPGQPVVGMGAMIKEWKGQLVLVQAMLALRERHPRLLCVIVGAVSDRDVQAQAYLGKIEAFIREHDLGDQVRILGYEKNVGELLQVFDVMVHASIDPEPFSRVVLEGMLLGRAIVGTRTGGTVEQLEHGVSGLLVRPNDPGDLAEQIDYLLRYSEIRTQLGQRARERVMQRFLIAPHVAGVQRIFESVLAKGRA